jgi:hypothetical protein
MTIKDQILARLALAERDEESLPLGCTLRLRELTRAQWRDAQQFASIDDLAEREKARGLALASADLADEDARRSALAQYWQGAPERVLNIDRWHASVVASSAIDPETGEPIFTRDEILLWPHRADLWGELARLAQAVFDVSEVNQEDLKKES